MPVRLRVQTLTIKPEILRQRVQERAVVALHGLEAEPLRRFIGGENPKLALVRDGPLDVLGVHLHRLARIGHVGIAVLHIIGVDVQRQREAAVALEAGALVVALEGFSRVALAGAGGEAFGLCLEVLAVARYHDAVLARLVLLAGGRRVAFLFARVAAALFWFAACLLAWLGGVLAVARSMALLLACVRTAAEFAAADQAAAGVG